MSGIADIQSLPVLSSVEWRWAMRRALPHVVQPPLLRVRDERITPEAIAPERLRLASAGIRWLSAIIRQLVELRNEEESDEYGALRASESAFERACQLLTDAAIVSALEGRQIPHGCASTDSEGGIRIEWVRPASSVHLAIPSCAEREGYVYHEVGQDFGTITATPEALARWLREIN
jgi:hypothetical protein